MIYVSDSHVSDKQISKIDTKKQFESIINYLKNTQENDIIFLGDNIQNGTDDEYVIFFKLLNNIRRKNIYIIGGNHDDGSKLEKWCKNYKVNYCFNNYLEISNNNYYFIDSVVKGQDYGFINNEAFISLESYLNMLNKKTVICLHHHLQNAGYLIDDFIVKNKNELIDLLHKYKQKISYVISGHTHNYQNHIVDNINYINSPSSSFVMMKNGSGVKLVAEKSILFCQNNQFKLKNI